jgi:hypothetical protein
MSHLYGVGNRGPAVRRAEGAERGETLKQFVTEALREKVAVNVDKTRSREPGWMEGFGKLRRLRKETQRIQARIDERFEAIEPEDRVSPVSSAVV